MFSLFSLFVFVSVNAHLLLFAYLVLFASYLNGQLSVSVSVSVFVSISDSTLI